MSELIAARVSPGQPVALELDGFLLLSDSPATILRDGDIIDVIAASAGGVTLKTQPPTTFSATKANKESDEVKPVRREKRKKGDDSSADDDDDNDTVPQQASAGKKKKDDDVVVKAYQKTKQSKQQPEKSAPASAAVASKKPKQVDDSRVVEPSTNDHRRSKPTPTRVTKFVVRLN